jgi:hypothetical protein
MARKQNHPKTGEARPQPASGEFSRLFDVSRLGQLPHRIEISASPAERGALARRFDLPAIEHLDAAITVRKRGDGIVEVTGRMRARVIQRCVVSLEDVVQEIDEPLAIYFGAPTSGLEGREDALDDEAFPEPIVGGRIDCGEAVAQQLAAALDPYPRAPGAELPEH